MLIRMTINRRDCQMIALLVYNPLKRFHVDSMTSASQIPALVKLTSLSHFYGRFQALKDVSLTIEPGAIGLVG